MLGCTAQAEANRTKEDEELDQEMDYLKYRVKRVQGDLDYNAVPLLHRLRKRKDDDWSVSCCH